MDKQHYLKLAETIAREAGAILAEGAGLRHINFQDTRDVKLKADVDSEKLIRARLAQVSDFPIIGEEEGGDAALPDSDVYYWVVDPLDGTYNYLRSMPACCVSIGLMKGLEPVLGVIFDFNNGECFTADGETLWLDGKPIQPRWAESVGKGVLATGFPAGRNFSSDSLTLLIESIQSYGKIRMIGSASLALAYAAIGRVDAYTEDSIRLWDIAGGLALAKAAGATIEMTPATTGLSFAYDIWVRGLCAS